MKLNYTVVRVFVLNNGSDNQKLREAYKIRIKEHNKKSRSIYPDAGFDILNPTTNNFPSKSFGTFVPLGIKCGAFEVDYHNNYLPVSFYIYPRSSISKTPLRLSNGTGIIDSGYRGELIGAFDNHSDEFYETEEHRRLLQICTGDLQPFVVEIVDKEELLGRTDRGDGGFGSTGQ